MNERIRPQNEPADTRQGDRTPREYSHGSGDRNTRHRDEDRGEFHGGEQREAGTDDRPPGGGRP